MNPDPSTEASIPSKFEVISQVDKTTNDLLIPIPPPMLAQLGWSESDQIEIKMVNGKYYLVKV